MRSLLADWERGDWTRTDWADPDIEFVINEGTEAGRWTGVAPMAQAWPDWASTWDDLRSEARDYRALDDKRVLALGRMSARDMGSVAASV